MNEDGYEWSIITNDGRDSRCKIRNYPQCWLSINFSTTTTSRPVIYCCCNKKYIRYQQYPVKNNSYNQSIDYDQKCLNISMVATIDSCDFVMMNSWVELHGQLVVMIHNDFGHLIVHLFSVIVEIYRCNLQ